LLEVEGGEADFSAAPFAKGANGFGRNDFLGWVMRQAKAEGQLQQ